MTLTVREAAEESRRCEKTIRNAIKQYQSTKHLSRPKGLKAFRPRGGRAWVIREPDFVKWLEGK